MLSVDDLKQKLRQSLHGWRPRMEKAGITTIYALLSSYSLWPILLAYQQGQFHDMAGVMALGALLSSLGINVVSTQLTNQLEKWRGEIDSEEKLAQRLEALPADSALHADLEAMLDKLGALELARESLSESDKAWFGQMLRDELRRLGHFKKYQAKIEGDWNVVVQGDSNVVTVNITTAPPTAGPSPLPLPEALGRYLDNLVETHQRLRLQGIRAGSQPLSIDLEKVYISLTAIEKGARRSQAKDEMDGLPPQERDPSGILTIAAALKRYQRLVIIGDPGSGKTTLLAYLALTYARTLRDGTDAVRARLGLAETEHLPILLPLRDFGRHLKTEHPDPGKDGPALLLDYVREYYVAQSILLPPDFFANELEAGRAVVLLDGMDEVAETKLRQRVARLIEKFALRYSKDSNRFIVTSREVGYDGPARIGADFGLARVREFNRDEVRRFVRDWTRAVETTLAGHESPDLLRSAAEQAEKLIAAIESNARVSDLAVNPLLLTVIAMVHRYRASLPDRRSELYEEAVEVLLGHWDEAKGLDTEVVLAGRTFDSGDRRSLLEPVAFWLHEKKRRDIELDDLRKLLAQPFINLANGDKAIANKAVDAFIHLINERSGLLIERGTGVYGFAHLTFQEYLTARAVADGDDFIGYSLKRLPDPWWRETILLEAGYLSTQGKRRVSDLIRAIMQADSRTEPEPCHHLVLAAECLFDVGGARVEGDLLGEVKRRLQKEVDAPARKGDRDLILRKVAASSALGRIESGQLGGAGKFWKLPYGEPDWVTIPAGEFWMGEGKELHRVNVGEYQIARTPITNAQYALFVTEAKIKPPVDWRDNQPSRGKENHPVVSVTWHEALAYCRWLSEKIERDVRLPSEAEWEKAARGDGDKRQYPWGDEWAELRCNSKELGLDDTSPVGIFLNGASPYGVLDLSGNVWEWTRSLWGEDWQKPSFGYPYDPTDKGREDLNAPDKMLRMLRGGSFVNGARDARCASRRRDLPRYRLGFNGFRVVAVPFNSAL
jgi:formylglycine-generating enzyme required for sulfatase activity